MNAENEDVRQIEIVWNGVRIGVTYAPVRFRIQSHIELRVLEPPEALIPVTETGYRSHFIPLGTIEAFEGGLERYVRVWLDEAAQDPVWQRKRQQSLQLDLF